MEKIDARTLKPEVQQRLRNKAIRFRNSGRKYKEIVAIVDVYTTIVCKWCKAYKRDGAKSIRTKKIGWKTRSCSTLTKEKEKRFRKAIIDKEPDQLKLPFTLGTRIAVQQLIKQLWSIDMPIRTVGEYWTRWGFTPQKPLRRAYE